jgi:hypothetical protein
VPPPDGGDAGLKPWEQSRSEGLGWWEALVTLQFVASGLVLMTPDLQSGSRIASRRLSRDAQPDGV